MWTVYVLLSKKSRSRYVGMTKDLGRRITEHNAGKSKFTSGHLPWVLVYHESFQNSKQARVREKYFKSAAGRRYLDKIMSAGSLPD